MKVKVKNCETGEKLKVMLRTNHGLTKSKSIKIRIDNKQVRENCTSTNEEIHDYKKSHPEFWKAETVTQASARLYGDVSYQEGNFEIIMPEVAANPGSMRIQVSSDLDLESIAILSNANPYAAIAIFSVPEGTKAKYALKIKAMNDDNDEKYVVVIGKSKKGKYYKSIKFFTVARSGGNCS